MIRTKFQTRTWILLAGIAALTAAPRAAAQTTASTASELDARLEAELGVAGGLTSEQVAARASATSFDVRARRAEVLEAAAEVDRAASGYIPRLTATARYTRVSDESADSSLRVVVAPTAGPGVIPAGTPLVNVPLEFPTIQNQYSFQAGLVVPLSDYFTRVSPAHTAAEHGVKAATFSEQASRRKAATEAKLAYYGWVRARLDVIVA